MRLRWGLIVAAGLIIGGAVLFGLTVPGHSADLNQCRQSDYRSCGCGKDLDNLMSPILAKREANRSMDERAMANWYLDKAAGCLGLNNGHEAKAPPGEHPRTSNGSPA